MSLGSLWSCLAILLPVVAALVAPLPAVDLAYQIRLGDLILDGHGIPSTDTFTFTAAGLPYADQQWGGQVFFSAVHRLGGWPALSLLRAGLVGATFAMVYVACRLRGAEPRVAAWLTLGAFVVSSPALALRPQLFGMMFLALTLVPVMGRRRWPRALWTIPIVILAWANIHGSFVLAPIVLGAALLEDVADRHSGAASTLVVACVSVAATLANPAGLGVWTYALGIATNPSVTARITEWQPTSLRTGTGLLFYASVVAVAVLLARSPRRTRWTTIAMMVPFVVIGAFAERGIAWWPLVAAVVVGGVVTRPVERQPRAHVRLNAAVFVAVIAATFAALPVWRPSLPTFGLPDGLVTDAPIELAIALRSIGRPTDRLLNPQPWGSWFEYAVPTVPVAIDSRIELFPSSVWDDYTTVTTGGHGWRDILDRWGVTLAVVPADDPELADRLQDHGWRPVHLDDAGLLLAAPGRP